MKRYRFHFVLLAAASPAVGFALRQRAYVGAAYSDVAGVVVHVSTPERPLDGALATLTDLDNPQGPHYGGPTDLAGEYVFERARIGGRYSLSVAKEGYEIAPAAYELTYGGGWQGFTFRPSATNSSTRAPRPSRRSPRTATRSCAGAASSRPTGSSSGGGKVVRSSPTISR